MKLADDFGIGYDNRQKHRIKPHIREPTPEQRCRQEESRCYKVLSDYFHHLRTWKQQYAPKQPEDEWHPLFVEALQRESHIEYLLDVLLYGTAEEKKALVMKWILKLLTAPIVLTIDLFTLACVGIISCSAILFRIVSSIVALLGVMVLVTYSPKNGIILLVIAFLVSPMGLPMFAVWILSALQGISHFFKSI